MKLTKELKNKIENYFENTDPDELVNDLITNFNCKEIIINNNIKENYVSFEVAKILKDKGFEVETYGYYNYSNEKFEPEFKLSSKFRNYNLEDCIYSAPTHSIVIKWIKENFGYWVHSAFPLNNGKWEWVIFDLNSPLQSCDGYKNIMSLNHEPYYFNSSEESTENAILHVLTELI